MLIDLTTSLAVVFLSLPGIVTGSPIDDNSIVDGLEAKESTAQLYHGLEETTRGAKQPRGLNRVEGFLGFEKRQLSMPLPETPPPNTVVVTQPAPPPATVVVTRPPPPPSTVIQVVTAQPTTIPSSTTVSSTASSPPVNPDVGLAPDDSVEQTTIRPLPTKDDSAQGDPSAIPSSSQSQGHNIILRGGIYPVFFCFLFYFVL
ncbi:hypothetical protein BKA70DRAFT_1283464 [Coprinopsis sp. MPI-PUGE-AT-0042]|nr:hypothetical protein BKA70DRAFT_1283464 [Coprinopsis sp. MPI-PUGE-AT-0042]